MLSMIKTFLNRSFLFLFFSQYLGAFNDNFFRTAIAAFITYRVTTISDHSRGIIVSLAVALFILPYFLFSAQAGELADKLRKDILIKATKLLEVIIAILGGIGFIYGNIPLLLVVLFLMGTQSTFFGPVKYSILPDILKEKQLISGNGIIEAGTYGAILQGTIFGGIIIAKSGHYLPMITISVALAGFICSMIIPAQKPANPALKVDINFLRSTWKNISFAKESRPIFLCVLGISWFWLLGTAMISQMPALAKDVLNGTPELFTFLLTLFSCGIGLGSLLCQFLVKGEITSKYVPLSAILMTVFLADLAFACGSFPHFAEPLTYKTFFALFEGKRITVDLLGFALCGGLYVVPLNAMLQALSSDEIRSRIIATNNIINAFFMVAGSGFCALLLGFNFTIPQVFGAIALLNAFAAVYICGLLPAPLVRMIVKRVLNLVYGVKISGLANYKKLGQRGLIIANHTSFLDAVLLWVYLPDDVYYAIDTFVAKKWWVQPILHLVKYFPIDPTNPMAVKSIIEEVKKGRRVVIFPEGRITTTGGLMKIYPGPSMIADKSQAEILPVYIDGSQYSIFGRFSAKFRTRPHSKITVKILPPVSLGVAQELTGRARRQSAARRMYDIMCNMKYSAADLDNTLFETLLEAMSLVGRKKIIAEDINRKPLSFGKFITSCFALGKVLSKRFKQGEHAGFMLPNACASAVAFFALRAFNITPCMINFSIGVKNILACSKAAKIKTVISSRAFIKQGGLEDTAKAMEENGLKFIWLEEIAQEISFCGKFSAWCFSFIPRFYYKHIRGKVCADDTAVVLFTSGSEGLPKGVALSHKNIQANIRQLSAVLDFGPLDMVFNAMPIFHSFGLTGGTLLPLLCGIKVFFYPSPLHYRIVPELIYDTNATVIFGTDTFLSGYAKMAHPYDFYSVRLAVAGAEKLKEETARIMADTFGVRVMEGYGATETAPALAINTPMYFKRGTVGRFLPGIEVKLEKVPGVEEGGRLFVRGNNIMRGYLKADKPGVLQQPQGGWYDTGDIVSLDEEGFVKIQGRAKRFAKIAGEMISLSAVETALAEIWPDCVYAVISVPDEKKGEQLILFTNRKDCDRKALQAEFKAKGLSELALPKTITYMEQIPLTGTGKTDYVKLKELAA